MLGTGAFALAALDAVAGLALVLGDDGVFPDGAEPGAALLPVFHVEDFGNGNAHGTALGAVMAGGAGDGLVRVQGLLGLPDDRLFRVGQGPEVAHKA